MLIVACFSLLADTAHAVDGTKEITSIASDENNISLTLNRKQAMLAFQMLSIDLIVVTIFFTISLTDLLSFEYELTLFLSLLYLLWGIVWLVQLVRLKSNAKIFMYLPQCFFWFLGSGLLYVSA